MILLVHEGAATTDLRVGDRPGVGLRQDRQRRQRQRRRDHLRAHAPGVQPPRPGAGVGGRGPAGHHPSGGLGRPVRLQPGPAAVPASTPTPVRCCGVQSEPPCTSTASTAPYTPNYPADPATTGDRRRRRCRRRTSSARSSWARSAGPFNRAKLANGTTENRGGESTLGNLVAEVQRWATESPTTGSAQIAFMNPGGLRRTWSARGTGVTRAMLTYRQAAEVQPFANTLVNMELTGAQIKAALEQQWQPAGSRRVRSCGWASRRASPTPTTRRRRGLADHRDVARRRADRLGGDVLGDGELVPGGRR